MKSIKDDLISIIVPVYKVEQYLDKCVKSIVNQTYSNLEIVLVDDGSPDNCANICDAWAKTDCRIKVIHKKNGGLSDARNVGILNSSGDYIAFVDSDDWIASDMYEKLLLEIKRTSSDIASCGALRVWEDESHEPVAMMEVHGKKTLSTVDAMEALINSTCLIQTVWNKLYRREILEGVLFEKGKVHEDELWTWQIVAKAERVCTIDDNLYYYLQRSGSIMNDGYTGFPMIPVEARYQRHQYISEHFPQLEDADSVNFLYFCNFTFLQILKYEHPNKAERYYKEINSMIRNCTISKKYYDSLSKYKRLRIVLMKRNLKLSCRLEQRIRKV